MGLLYNRIDRDSLKPGDHIYSWRSAYIYSHHGIYVGDDKVIHFTRHDRKVAGTVWDNILGCSLPSRPQVPCTTCVPPEGGQGVISSCLDCFLSGGILCRFEYRVNIFRYLATVRGGTCITDYADPLDVAVHRAKILLEKGFGDYDLADNNCEDFAIYCKAGLIAKPNAPGQSGQAAAAKSLLGSSLVAVMSTSLRIVTANPLVIVATAATAVAGHYCIKTLDRGLRRRRDVVKVEVEDLNRKSKHI